MSESIGSWLLASERCRPAIAAVLHEETEAFAGLPSVDAVGRNVREEQIPPLFVPHRPLDPGKPIGNFFQLRIVRHKLIETRIETINLKEMFSSLTVVYRSDPQGEGENPSGYRRIESVEDGAISHGPLSPRWLILESNGFSKRHSAHAQNHFADSLS